MVFFAGNAEHLTELPAYNDFQMAIESLLEGGCGREDVEKLHHQLDLTLSQVLYYFYEQVHFQVATEELESRSVEVFRGLDLLREEVSLAFKAALSEDDQATRAHLDCAREHLTSLMQHFAHFREQEEALPKFSDLAWVNELCRVAVCCRQGQLTVEHLAERLDTCFQLQERAALSLPQVPPLIPDRNRWNELIQSMGSALETILEGLHKVDEFLETHQDETLDAGLELCTSGAGRLLEDCETLKLLEEKGTQRLCPRCSKETPSEAGRCVHCLAPIPRLAQESEVLEAEQPWPEHVSRLLRQLQAWQMGQIDEGQAMSALESLRSRFEKGQTNLQSMSIPDLGSPDDRQFLVDTRSQVISASQAALAGLDEIQQALGQGQPDLVSIASESFLRAVEALMEAYQRGQQRVA